MSGAGGKWMVSSVTEEQITKLRKAGYLSNDIAHRLPEVGQLIPTPRPEERGLPPSFPPRTGLSAPSFRPGDYVLLRPRFSRSGPELCPQHLGVYRRVRGLSPHPPPLRPLAQDLQRQA